MKTETYTSPKIKCEGCASTIREALGAREGVSGVQVDVPTRTVTVAWDDARLTDADVRATLAEAGFPAQN